MHSSSHIMLKAKLPLPESRFIQARSAAKLRMNGYEGDRPSLSGPNSPHTPRHHPSPPYWRHGPPPGSFDRGLPPVGPWGLPPPPGPWGWRARPRGFRPPEHDEPPFEPWFERWRGPPHAFGHGRGPRGPPPIYLINTGGGPGASVQRLDSLEHLNIANAGQMNLPHDVMCSSCSQQIFGIRWLCVNCPTTPTTDLVSHPDHSFGRAHLMPPAPVREVRKGRGRLHAF